MPHQTSNSTDLAARAEQLTELAKGAEKAEKAEFPLPMYRREKAIFNDPKTDEVKTVERVASVEARSPEEAFDYVRSGWSFDKPTTAPKKAKKSAKKKKGK